MDGSKASLAAVDALVAHAAWFRDRPQVELVTIHLPVPKLPGMGVVVGRKALHRYYKDEGEARLRAAKRKLAAAGIPFEARTLVGDIAPRIVGHAMVTGCDLIFIGSRGLGAVRGALVGSTATKVLQLSRIPVLLVK